MERRKETRGQNWKNGINEGKKIGLEKEKKRLEKKRLEKEKKEEIEERKRK